VISKELLILNFKKFKINLKKEGVSGMNVADVMIIIAFHCTIDIFMLFIIPYAFQFQWE
jgi:hypothetical protein